MLRWLERGLLVTGAAALAWCGALVAELMIAQRSAREGLRPPPVERPLLVPALEDETVPEPGNPVTAQAGSAVAILAIPRIGLSAAVLRGSDARTLRRGPGHLENTADPGRNGNAVIAGHRDTFFWPLRKIRVGDDIFIDMPDRQFHYRVTRVRVVGPRDVSVLAPTSESVLTLITCYPFWVLGPAPDRFVVQAAAVVNGSVGSETALAPAPQDEAPIQDDEVLIRLTVDRYRLANGLKLDACEVAVAGGAATAGCPDAPELLRRIFALQRSAGGWAIRSIELHEPR